jgi:hypothetical protein
MTAFPGSLLLQPPPLLSLSVRWLEFPMPQRFADVPIADLVPETRPWNDGKGIDLLSWLSCVGSYNHAIAYGELFWPDFVEHEGCVFLAGFSEDSYRGFMDQTKGNKKAVEAVMNHRHILDLFPADYSTASKDQIAYLGRLLREIWETKLRRDFPARKFVVSFPEESLEDLLDFEVTFFQEHDGTS